MLVIPCKSPDHQHLRGNRIRNPIWSLRLQHAYWPQGTNHLNGHLTLIRFSCNFLINAPLSGYLCTIFEQTEDKISVLFW